MFRSDVVPGLLEMPIDARAWRTALSPAVSCCADVLSSVLLDARSRFCIFPALGRKPHITHSVKFNVGLVAFLDWFVAQLLSQTRGLPITLAKCCEAHSCSDREIN